METTKKAIAKIENDGIDEIIKIAIENFVEGFNSIVFLDGNWIANNSWEVCDILTDEEYEDLKKAVAKKEGISEKLELIGITLSDRLEEYLIFSEMESQIIEKLKDQDY